MVAIAALTAACAAGRSAPRAVTAKHFYERVREQLALHPDARSRLTPPEMASLDWLVGRWTGTVKAFATPSSPEKTLVAGEETFQYFPDSNMLWHRNAKEGPFTLVPEIGFDPFSRVWVIYVGAAPRMWGVLTADGWDGNRLAFIGDVTIFGVKARLRRTMVKTSETELEILNDEQFEPGTPWVPVDAYHLTKVPMTSAGSVTPNP